MVIKPYGYAIWEKCRELDRMKETGIKMLISIICSKSMFEAEEKMQKDLQKNALLYTLQVKKRSR
jgi:prolyl-tRNA synthetase